LTKYVDQLIAAPGSTSDNSCVNTRVFVPLCGKTIDLAYLTTKAAHVVGVEGIRIAIEQFAQEQSQLNVVETAPIDGFEKFDGSKITLLKGDYFRLDATKHTDGQFGAIFDRASLVAIEPNLRRDYVQILNNLLQPEGKILLAVLERRGTDEAMKRGPPYSVSETNVKTLFEESDWVDSVDLLETTDQLEIRPEDRSRFEGLDQLLEKVYLIKKKA